MIKDTEVFEDIYKDNYTFVRAFCAKCLGKQRHLAEDIAQNVFIRAFLHLHQYRNDKSSIKTWLATIARNQCFDFFKSQYYRKTMLVDNPGLFFSNLEQQEQVSEEYWKEREDKIERIFAVAKSLDDKSYAIIRLRYSDGHTSEDVARILGCSPDLVRQRNKRALDFIKHSLTGIRVVKKKREPRQIVTRKESVKKSKIREVEKILDSYVWD